MKSTHIEDIHHITIRRLLSLTVYCITGKWVFPIYVLLRSTCVYTKHWLTSSAPSNESQVIEFGYLVLHVCRTIP